MRYQEAFSRSKPWDWLLGPFRSRPAEETPATSIIESEEALRDEVEDALEKFGIGKSAYRLRLLMCPTVGPDGEELIVGPEDWILCVTLTQKSGDIVSAMSKLEKYLHRRLTPYGIRVRATYWRMAAA
jgi:hypothetical protein